MSDTRTVTTSTNVFAQPIHAMLGQFPFVCFIGALVTDIVYSRSPDIQWANFSAWLLFFGLAFGVLAAIAGIVDFARHRNVREQAPAWPHSIGNAVVLLLALWNNFVHSRDAWTSVVPTGLILSALTVIVMLVTAWFGGTTIYHERTEEAR